MMTKQNIGIDKQRVFLGFFTEMKDPVEQSGLLKKFKADWNVQDSDESPTDMNNIFAINRTLTEALFTPSMPNYLDANKLPIKTT